MMKDIEKKELAEKEQELEEVSGGMFVNNRLRQKRRSESGLPELKNQEDKTDGEW